MTKNQVNDKKSWPPGIYFIWVSLVKMLIRNEVLSLNVKIWISKIKIFAKYSVIKSKRFSSLNKELTWGLFYLMSLSEINHLLLYRTTRKSYKIKYIFPLYILYIFNGIYFLHVSDYCIYFRSWDYVFFAYIKTL